MRDRTVLLLVALSLLVCIGLIVLLAIVWPPFRWPAFGLGCLTALGAVMAWEWLQARRLNRDDS